jgi:hypothetical protein
MGKILGLVVLALLGFYVAWPAYTGYAIKSALDSDNATLLASKIDFDRLRESLKPAVTAEADKAATAAIQQGAGANAALLKQLQTQLLPAVVDKLLVDVVTPETVLRLNREGGNYKATLAQIIAEKMGGASLGSVLGGGVKPGSGGLGDLIGGIGKAAGVDTGKALGGLFGGPKPQEPAAPAPADGAPKRSVSLANIKTFGMNGPLGFSVGVAKDPSASVPDVTADIAFTGFDWKLVGLRPRI